MTTARSKRTQATHNRVALHAVVRHYVVTAYRWGMRDAHSYVVGCYDTKRQANKAARLHKDWRGGKYGIEVIECNRKMDAESGENAGKQVSYIESHYHGRANQNRPAMQPAQQGKWLEKLKVPCDEFARADGFKNFFEMRDWFKATHGLPFEGVVIKWHNGALCHADGRGRATDSE